MWWQCDVDVDIDNTTGSRWEYFVDRVHGHHVVVVSYGSVLCECL